MPPDLTPEQRADAAARAVAARRRRADVRARLKSGDVSVAEVMELAASDEALGRMRVASLLEALPRVGPIRAGEIMDLVGIAPSRRLAGLGERQARDLMSALRARGRA